MNDERLYHAADVAYGKFYPNTSPAITGKERAWRGDPEKNPLLRPLRAAIDDLKQTPDATCSSCGGPITWQDGQVAITGASLVWSDPTRPEHDRVVAEFNLDFCGGCVEDGALLA